MKENKKDLTSFNVFDDVENELNESIRLANESEETIEIDEKVTQGSKEWFKLRLGKFSGSKIPSLMTRGRAKDEEWGDTAKKIITSIYVERDLTEIGIELYVNELFGKEFRQTAWGNRYEADARKLYSEKTGNQIDLTSFRLHEKYDFIGTSSDGEIINKNGIVEIKCPYDVTVHVDNCELEDGITESHKYYGQMQNNIFVTGVDFCDFISYDPRRKNKNIAIIRVERDNAYIDKMLKRIIISNIAIDNYMMPFGLTVSEALILAENDYDEAIRKIKTE